jgi:hypothetical protein
VTVQPEPAADRPAGDAAGRAAAGPRFLHRRRGCDPGLDVAPVMNDSSKAPVSDQRCRGSTGSVSLALSPSPISAGDAPEPDLQRAHYHQPR